MRNGNAYVVIETMGVSYLHFTSNFLFNMFQIYWLWAHKLLHDNFILLLPKCTPVAMKNTKQIVQYHHNAKKQKYATKIQLHIKYCNLINFQLEKIYWYLHKLLLCICFDSVVLPLEVSKYFSAVKNNLEYLESKISGDLKSTAWL